MVFKVFVLLETCILTLISDKALETLEPKTPVKKHWSTKFQNKNEFVCMQINKTL